MSYGWGPLRSNAWGPWAREVPGLMSGEGPGAGGCTVRSNASRVMIIWGPLNRMIDTQTPMKTLPYRNFVGGRKKITA